LDNRTRHILDRLGAHAPQVLLIEGASGPERVEAAFAWAARLNCATGAGPCGSCAACRQVLAGQFRDLLVFDSRDDGQRREESRNEERNVKVDEVREALPLFVQPPSGAGVRVVLFLEAQRLIPSVANLLLKSFEEPNPGTVFAMTAPHRERLLPTLVSRSWVLSLAWPDAHDAGRDAGVADWVQALGEFARSGRGWFRRTGGKGAVKQDTALAVVLACQRELAATLRGEAASGPAAALLERLGPEGPRRWGLALDLAQDGLNLSPPPVNPALILDWLATRLTEWMG
jgi:DNA polymerase III subunit delta'